MAAAAVFVIVNSAAVSLVISFNEGKPARSVFLDGIDLRVLVWAGGTALGLVTAIGASAYSWALALGALPMAALNLVMREDERARRRTKRSHELLAAAGQVHASVRTIFAVFRCCTSLSIAVPPRTADTPRRRPQ